MSVHVLTLQRRTSTMTKLRHSALAMCVALCLPAMATADTWDQEIRPMLTEYCIGCHGPDTAEGNLRIDRLTGDFADHDNAAAWIEVRDRINLGEMPPTEAKPLPVDSIERTSRWIASNLRNVERQQSRAGEGVLLRRLNRYEYTNTVADLLAMSFPPGESPLDFLPPDGTAEGFDKVSTALLLDPSLMTQYYEIARRIAERAIVDGPPEFPTAKMKMEFEEMGTGTALGYLLTRLGMEHVPGGLRLIQGSTRSFGMLRYPGRSDNNVAPVSGFYRFTIRAGGKPGADGQIPRIQVRHKHPDDSMSLIMEVDVTAPWDQPAEYSVTVPRDTAGGELSVQLVNETNLYMGQRPGENFFRRNRELGDEGSFAETLRLDGRKVAEGWGGERSTPDPDKLDLTRYPQVFLDYLEVEGPLYEQWPPKSHTLIFFQGDGGPQDLLAAREILKRFLPRAWRGPVGDEELLPILNVVRTELENGQSFHEAMRVGLSAVLSSPRFLYLVESAEQAKAGLSDYELASRLSYFLWNSMPDDELFRLAQSGTLHELKTLRAQVDRMLDDPKADRLVESFGRQWLKTDTFLAFTPDQNLYKGYDDPLAEAVVREPLEFFRTLLRDDLSVLNFIDSDFVVVNERLAKHYGIAGVLGDDFRPVAVPASSPRGGVLAMAGVHQAGSDGIRTKPVSRAVYVRDVLFNDPPDPPPPNAGEVEPNLKGQQRTVRERLIQHQEILACASCHRSLDPYGLAMENFNVVGLWRDRQDGEDFRGSNAPPIDASGQLPNGAEFEGFEDFRQHLFAQDDRFRRGLAEKLMVYALGRPIGPSDDETLTRIVSEMKASGDTFRSLIQSLITSREFLSP